MTIRLETAALAMVLLLGASAYGAEKTNIRTMTCAFSDPGKPGVVIVSSGSGDVTITGYSGSEVKIKASSSDEKAFSDVENEKAKGLKRIAGAGFNVRTIKDDNAVVISRSMNSDVNLEIQTPYNTSLVIGGSAGDNGNYSESNMQNLIVNSMKIAFNFSGIFEGNITITDIRGEMEINTLDGDIDLKNISGPVVANAMDGDINAVFKLFPEGKPMAFSTMDGDIDITMPSVVKATVTAITTDGEVYTDFDLEIVPEKAINPADQFKSTRRKAVKPERQTGSPRVGRTETIPPGPGIFGTMIGNTVTGTINGGGIDILMKTVDGSLYIRKAK